MPCRRSVNFSEELCQYHEGAVLDVPGAAVADIWMQYPELQAIKRKALLLSREPDKHNLASLLTNTYGRSDKDAMTAIIAWALNCTARRGLERFHNKDYSTKRSEIRRRTLTSVLTAQRKMHEEGIHDSEYIEKVLSRLSQAFSQDSRSFARVTGIADEKLTERQQGVILAHSPIASPVKKPRIVMRQISPNSIMDLPIYSDSENSIKHDLAKQSNPTTMQYHCMKNVVDGAMSHEHGMGTF